MIIKEFKEKTQKIIEDFHNEILKFRTSRPTTAFVEDIKVDCYGSLTPLKHIASISIKLPNSIIIEFWDENLIEKAKKAIENANLGVNPIVEGKQIKIFLPPLSKDRKEEIIKLLGIKKEEFRIRIREAREEFIEKIKAKFEDKEISEDEKFRLKDEIQEIVEETNKSLDKEEERKTDEILNS